MAKFYWKEIIPWTRLLRAVSPALIIFRFARIALISLAVGETLFKWPYSRQVNYFMLFFYHSPTCLFKNMPNRANQLPLLIVLLLRLLSIAITVLSILLSCLLLISGILIVVVATNCNLVIVFFERSKLLIQNFVRLTCTSVCSFWFATLSLRASLKRKINLFTRAISIEHIVGANFSNWINYCP